jgi:chromosome segregation protein
MKFNRLRLIGFKSFCESTDFFIEPGLTGVVGPNGCGKSNLVEALRWVMGENSYKSMRASGMSDVIFSGSGNRASRNMAEVSLQLDNSDRSAPAQFNDAELLEVSRQIERDDGSTYRINGKEVRAKDVQLLFADASTGARSPALVRQGQISEIISAKPQQRRRILEEAAGVAGLHSRRHEAELRLKGAEENLLRLEDVTKQLDSQVESLRRQARQAARYKTLAADIRRQEALLYFISHRTVTREITEAERKLEADVRDVAERTRHQAEAARLQALAAHALPELRDAEARASAALQRLTLAREQLDQEEERSKARVAELERRRLQLEKDLAREKALIEDAAGVLDKLNAEEAELLEANEAAADAEYEAKERQADSDGRLAECEAALAEAQAALSDINARRNALEQSAANETQRLQRFSKELQDVRAELAQLEESAGSTGDIEALTDALAEAEARIEQADMATLAAEEAVAAARAAETAAVAPHTDAERRAQRLETEVRTLSKLLAIAESDLWPPVVEELKVEKGYEAAVGAALGDDLEASTNSSAPAHWAGAGDGASDPPLPPGVTSLADMVSAPPALARRMKNIGIVLRSDGAQLQKLLKPGQRLVSREGDLWRWDGFVAAAEAPTPAARRLAEKNRLGELTQEAEAAREQADHLKEVLAEAQAATRACTETEVQTRNEARNAARLLNEAHEALAAAERKRSQVSARISALEEAANRLAAAEAEAQAKKTEADEALTQLAPTQQLQTRLERARASAAQARVEASEARTAVQQLLREAQSRQQRREAISAEKQSWDERRSRAAHQIEDFESRIAEAHEEAEELAQAPDMFLQKRRALLSEIENADQARQKASDDRAAGENKLQEADHVARMALEAMGATREERARTEARVEGLRQRRDAVMKAITTDLECEPDKIAELAGVSPADDLPDASEVEDALNSMKADRERLGAVNLRADDELEEIEARRTELTTERDDLTEAIRKLRIAIGSLNREGRERLLAAFSVVNDHFKELFTTLFGGGEAELQLVESDDPLEAGLEIFARPPGKKLSTMSLMSGGEQALTAMSLIFAVFLTNPSPICVLDEVDAPLDDANVERLCDLLDEMVSKTDTRFVTITHNPITMARMDRLFGVTMAERGVSQLVSVDLQAAETLIAAE